MAQAAAHGHRYVACTLMYAVYCLPYATTYALLQYTAIADDDHMMRVATVLVFYD